MRCGTEDLSCTAFLQNLREHALWNFAGTPCTEDWGGGGGAHISLILPYVTSLGSGVPTSVIRLIWDEWCGPTRAFLLHLPNLFYRLAACPLIAVAAKSCLVILSLLWSIDDSTMAHNLRHRPSIELTLDMCVEPISGPTEFYLICLVDII